MDKFEELVKECRRKKSSRIIHNASIDHAEVLVRNLIQDASGNHESIKIISGGLRSDFYNDLSNDIKTALDSGCKVSTIVINPAAKIKDNKFADAINDSPNGKIVQNPEGSSINAPHFIVVGNKKFRIETVHDQTKARACFNNEEIGEFLSSLFDDTLRSIKKLHYANLFLARNKHLT